MTRYPGVRRLTGSYCCQDEHERQLGGDTQWPEPTASTIPDDPNLVTPIMREGFMETIDGWSRPKNDPFSFRINSHVWTTSELVYKFSQYLNVSARHLIAGKSRQRTLMRKAIETWLPHIDKTARREGDDAAWSDVDFVIRTEDLGSGLKKIADGSYPRSPRSYDGTNPKRAKSKIRWNENAWILDHEYAFEWALAVSAGQWGIAVITYAIIIKTHADYRELMIHELGHILGLGHSARTSAIMWPTDQNGRWSLGDHDIRAIRSLYPRRHEFGSVQHLDRAQAFARGMFTGGESSDEANGTGSFVVELGAQRRVLAWTVMGFVDSLNTFDEDNVTTVEVFAIGGRPDDLEQNEKSPQSPQYNFDDPDDFPENFPEIRAERDRQLTHEYFWSYQDDQGKLTKDPDEDASEDAEGGHYSRHPYRLDLVTENANQDQVNATAIYYGYAAARGSSVQFRACAYNPHDHEMYATGIALMLPEQDELGLSVDFSPGGEPPPPDPDPDVDDLMMVPDIQLPPPPKPGLTTPPPPKKPGFAAPSEIPEPGSPGGPDGRNGFTAECCRNRGGRRPPPKPCRPRRCLPLRSTTRPAESDDVPLKPPKGAPERRRAEDPDPDGRKAERNVVCTPTRKAGDPR